jgi:hypothetical protein
MKKLKYILFILLIVFYNCNQIKKEKIHEPVENNKEIIIANEMDKDNLKGSKEIAKTLPELFSINDFIGKYPTQVKLFENEILANRLKNINRLDYDSLIANWNTETPISIEDQIIHSSGCKAHNCPSNGYELFIDLKNDNINIYHFRSNTLRVYTEKEWITLPKMFQDEIDIKKSNAKIGSTSDDLQSTYTIYSKENPVK